MLSTCCRRFLCIYSIPIFRRVIQLFLIFCMFIKALYLLLFRGLCPHPASGIRPKFFGNHTDADGIRGDGLFGWLPSHLLLYRYFVILSLYKTINWFNTWSQFRYLCVHFFTTFSLARYSIFSKDVSLGNTLFVLVTFRYWRFTPSMIFVVL